MAAILIPITDVIFDSFLKLTPKLTFEQLLQLLAVSQQELSRRTPLSQVSILDQWKIRSKAGVTVQYIFQKNLRDSFLTVNKKGDNVRTFQIELKTNLYGEGGNLEHFYYFYPKRWGFATFTKNNFVGGGFKRLKRNASNKIEPATDFDAYDAGEQDIMIDNGVATDAFLVYMSVNDQIADDVEPIYVT